MELKAPFPYFGGKSRVAGAVWEALGQPKHYLEPFFGSGAVLLSRPRYNPDSHVETVNDKDGHICNVWRSLKFSPDETAKWADWPVNHADQAARKNALIENESQLLQNLTASDTFHDPKLAGYWIWLAATWIGAKMLQPQNGIGQIPHIGNAGRGVNGIESAGKIFQWFEALSSRLRRVRVVCGEWHQICGGNWHDLMGTAGFFFDPPYGAEDRAEVYSKDCFQVANKVRQWCIANGSKESYRIVLAGYYDEHKELEDHGWQSMQWKAQGGFAHSGQSKETRGQVNCYREALFFSPHCLIKKPQQKELW